MKRPRPPSGTGRPPSGTSGPDRPGSAGSWRPGLSRASSFKSTLLQESTDAALPHKPEEEIEVELFSLIPEQLQASPWSGGRPPKLENTQKPASIFTRRRLKSANTWTRNPGHHWEWRAGQKKQEQRNHQERQTHKISNEASFEQRYRQAKRWLKALNTKAEDYREYIDTLSLQQQQALAGLSSNIQGTVALPDLMGHQKSRPRTAPIFPQLPPGITSQSQSQRENSFASVKDSSLFNALSEARLRADQRWDARSTVQSGAEEGPLANKPNKKRHEKVIIDGWLKEMCVRMVVTSGLVAANENANVYDGVLADPLQAVGLGRRILQSEQVGLPDELVDRLYANLYVYTAGFQNQILEVVVTSPNRGVLVNKIWQAYLVLLECAEPALYEWSLKNLMNENSLLEARRTAIYVDTISARTASIEQLTAEVASLQGQVRTQREALLQDRLKLRRDEEKVMDFDRAQQAAMDYEASLRSSYQDLRATCARTAANIKQKENKLEILTQKRHTLSASNRELEKKISELHSRVSDAHKDFEELRSQVAITLEEENALRAEVVKVKRESEQWTVAVNNEERMVAAAEGRKEILQQTIVGYRREIANLQREAKVEAGDSSTITTRAGQMKIRLKARIVEVQRRIQSMKIKKKALQKVRQDVFEEFEMENAKASKIRLAEADLEKQVAEFQSRVEMIPRLVENAVKEAMEYKSKVATLRSEIAARQEVVRDGYEDQARLEKAVAEMQEDLERRKKDLASVVIEVEDVALTSTSELEIEQTEQRALLQAKKNLFEKAEREKQLELEESEAESKKEQELLLQVISRSVAFAVEKQDLEEEFDLEKSRLINLESNLSEADDEKAKAQKYLKLLDEELARTQDEVASTKQISHALKNEKLASLVKQHQEGRELLEKMETKFQKGELSMAQYQIKVLRDQWEAARTAVGFQQNRLKLQSEKIARENDLFHRKQHELLVATMQASEQLEQLQKEPVFSAEVQTEREIMKLQIESKFEKHSAALQMMEMGSRDLSFVEEQLANVKAKFLAEEQKEHALLQERAQIEVKLLDQAHESLEESQEASTASFAASLENFSNSEEEGQTARVEILARAAAQLADSEKLATNVNRTRLKQLIIDVAKQTKAFAEEDQNQIAESETVSATASDSIRENQEWVVNNLKKIDRQLSKVAGKTVTTLQFPKHLPAQAPAPKKRAPALQKRKALHQKLQKARDARSKSRFVAAQLWALEVRTLREKTSEVKALREKPLGVASNAQGIGRTTVTAKLKVAESQLSQSIATLLAEEEEDRKLQREVEQADNALQDVLGEEGLFEDEADDAVAPHQEEEKYDEPEDSEEVPNEEDLPFEPSEGLYTALKKIGKIDESNDADETGPLSDVLYNGSDLLQAVSNYLRLAGDLATGGLLPSHQYKLERKLHDAEVELAQAGKAARDYALRKALQPVEEAWKPSWLKRQLLKPGKTLRPSRRFVDSQRARKAGSAEPSFVAWISERAAARKVSSLSDFNDAPSPYSLMSPQERALTLEALLQTATRVQQKAYARETTSRNSASRREQKEATPSQGGDEAAKEQQQALVGVEVKAWLVSAKERNTAEKLGLMEKYLQEAEAWRQVQETQQQPVHPRGPSSLRGEGSRKGALAEAALVAFRVPSQAPPASPKVVSSPPSHPPPAPELDSPPPPLPTFKALKAAAEPTAETLTEAMVSRASLGGDAVRSGPPPPIASALGGTPADAPLGPLEPSSSGPVPAAALPAAHATALLQISVTSDAGQTAGAGGALGGQTVEAGPEGDCVTTSPRPLSRQEFLALTGVVQGPRTKSPDRPSLASLGAAKPSRSSLKKKISREGTPVQPISFSEWQDFQQQARQRERHQIAKQARALREEWDEDDQQAEREVKAQKAFAAQLELHRQKVVQVQRAWEEEQSRWEADNLHASPRLSPAPIAGHDAVQGKDEGKDEGTDKGEMGAGEESRALVRRLESSQPPMPSLKWPKQVDGPRSTAAADKIFAPDALAAAKSTGQSQGGVQSLQSTRGGGGEMQLPTAEEEAAAGEGIFFQLRDVKRTPPRAQVSSVQQPEAEEPSGAEDSNLLASLSQSLKSILGNAQTVPSEEATAQAEMVTQAKDRESTQSRASFPPTPTPRLPLSSATDLEERKAELIAKLRAKKMSQRAQAFEAYLKTHSSATAPEKGALQPGGGLRRNPTKAGGEEQLGQRER